MNYKLLSTIFALIFIFCLVAVPILAEEMNSANYRIESDSINTAGSLASSANYQINDTLGEIATGQTASTNYSLRAGYQQMRQTYIAISGPADITLTPNVQQYSGGVSDGSGATTVTTDSRSGYTLSIKASVSPALTTAGDSFADYTPALAGTPDYTWAITATDSEFGFTAEGSDISQVLKDNGAVCNLGALNNTSACWYNLSISDLTIAQSSSANHTAGTATTLRFRAESGASHTQTPGAYQASITLTALAN